MPNEKYLILDNIFPILYSLILTFIIIFIVKIIFMSRSNITKFRRNKSKDYKSVIKCLRIKYIIFFVSHFLFLLFCYYYIGIFCALFQNSINHLMYNTLISFGCYVLQPFILFIFPGMFRISSLSSKKSKCLYSFSKIIQCEF